MPAAYFPGKLIEQIHPVQIGFVAFNPAGLGQPLAIRLLHCHHNAGGNGKHIHMGRAIGKTNPPDTIFHTINLRTAHQHLFADIQSAGQNTAEIHDNTSWLLLESFQLIITWEATVLKVKIPFFAPESRELPSCSGKRTHIDH